MEQLIIAVHVLAAIGISVLILIQQGKGADMGASFGGGASQTLFGGRGSGNALTRTTAILAAIFFATSFALAVLAKNKAEHAGLIDIPTPATSEAPAQPPTKPVDDVPAVNQNAAPATGDIPAAPTSPAPAQPQQSK
jgi:preprotein translocase subunit SecG